MVLLALPAFGFCFPTSAGHATPNQSTFCLKGDSINERQISDDLIRRLSDHLNDNENAVSAALDSLRREFNETVNDFEAIGTSDSTLTLAERNKKLYDDLSNTLKRRGFTRFLNKIILRPERDTTRHDKVMSERLQFVPYTGYTIASIEIEPRNIFENPNSVAKKAILATHVRTRRMTIRQDLMFGVGDTLNAELITNNLQLLRSRSIFYDVRFVITPVSEGSTDLNVRVETRDKWTIGVGARANGNGKTYGEISDANFLGFGNRLKYRLSLDWRKGEYHGSLFSYDIPNLFGTFYRSEMDIGRSFDHEIANVLINKKILKPNDYEVGARFTAEQLEFSFIKANASDTIRYVQTDLWMGFSRQFPKSPVSVFSMIRGYDIKHVKRNRIELDGQPLLIDAFHNPYFHNRRILLASVGLYAESFLTATNVFQYGVIENIAMGFNSELTVGYMNGEYHSGPYIGVSFKRGGFTKIGYMMQKISYGTFFSDVTRRAYQSTLNFEFDYFTNLLSAGRFRIRHFLWINYTNGWNRTDGSNEVLVFTEQSGPRAFREHLIGKKRLNINNETVLFTPWAPIGFRVVLFGFVDMGIIGNENDLFKNDFYASVGIGVRLRNERLVFRTLQLRLSVGFGKMGFVKNNWFKINTSQRMESIGYSPEPPTIVPYE